MINDFIEYWTATKLLLRGGNPYSPMELLTEQQKLGWSQPEPLMMWNPPWTLSFTLPFGLLDYSTAQFAWFLFHALILFVGAKLLWQTYGGSSKKNLYPVLGVLGFAPSYFALLLGQIGPLMLLGIIAFLAAAKERAWVWAGASLTLATVKPHLLYLVWLALLFWTVRNKQWKLAVTFAITAIITASLPLLFDRQAYAQYSDLLRTTDVTRPLGWATPSLGTALAMVFAIPDVWIRWLPSLGGGVWLVWYWSRHDRNWDWLAELPLLLAVSITTASFVWTFDHIVLLPAVIQAAVWVSREQVGRPQTILIVVYMALGVILLVAKMFVRNDFWYFWTAPAYLLLYLYARASAGPGKQLQSTNTAPA